MIFFKERTNIFSFIKNSEQKFPIKKIGNVVEVSSEVITDDKKTITSRQQLKITIKEQLTLIYVEFKQRYSSLRIKLELHRFGYKITRTESYARTGYAITVSKYMK